MSKNKKKPVDTLFSIALFNIPRHNLITKAAFQLLDEKAKAKVVEILKKGKTDPNNWGGWADQIKDSSPPTDAETMKFLKDKLNTPNKPWHYVNLPLETKSYQAAEQDGFTRENDVVQMYKACVTVLKDPKKNKRFSEVNALRLVGHLVGDIHQPLHIGCGFIDDSTAPPTIVSDPKTVISKNLQKKHDTGGNKIMLPGADNMHSFWDGSLSGPVKDVDLLAAAVSHQELELLIEIIDGAKKLGAKTNKIGLAVTNLEDLAQTWANDSIKLARQAYQNIVMEKKVGKNYQVKFKDGKEKYIEIFRPLILGQMKLAARRLADLINEIYA